MVEFFPFELSQLQPQMFHLDFSVHGGPAKDDGLYTETSQEQSYTESTISFLLDRDQSFSFDRSLHIRYLMGALEGLGPRFVSLDASKPWLIYWILHSLDLLGHQVDDVVKSRAVSTLHSCQHPDGGYSGGYRQVAHLAATYAAVHALALIGTDQAFESIDKSKLDLYLHEMKQPNGSFRMHHGGEIDVRGTYCALSVASLLGIMDDKLSENVPEFIASCQSYEGGIAGIPGVEAHGGYTYCAFAALAILDRCDSINLELLQVICL